jgi:uncharacterized protein
MAHETWYNRYLELHAVELIQPGKVLVLYGPRRVGKTELVKRLIDGKPGRTYIGTGDDMDLQSLFATRSLSKLASALGSYDLLFIDEAQYIPEVGAGLKLLADHFPQMAIIVSGSSSFQLAGQLGEPLTGRQRIRILYPISALELNQQYGGMELIHKRDELMIFGSYPETLSNESIEDKKEYLLTLRDSYLLKDILQFEDIRYAQKINDLLKLLAFQIGHEVSLNELSNNLSLSRPTVERYLDLLQKTFIIKKVAGFSRNLRSEISKSSRYYFWDNGIRNALINNFNPLESRNDQGMLWENFLFIERIKKQEYNRMSSNNYFWRTYTRQEIDFVEEREGKLFGYEFKWGLKKSKEPQLWKEAYPEASFEVINRDDFIGFIT